MSILDKHIVSIEGKSYVLYAGLLQLAKQEEITRMHVQIEQIPMAQNGYMAIVRATVVTKEGASYSDIADASPESVGDHRLIPHLLRVASTRAKARVLKDALAVDMTSMEELPVSAPNPPTKLTAVGNITPAQLKLLESQCEQLHLPQTTKNELISLSKGEASKRIDEYNLLIKKAQRNTNQS
jgi:hypothetical protein